MHSGGAAGAVGLSAVLIPFIGGLWSMGQLVPSDVAAAGVFLVGPWAVGVLLRHARVSQLSVPDRTGRRKSGSGRGHV